MVHFGFTWFYRTQVQAKTPGQETQTTIRGQAVMGSYFGFSRTSAWHWFYRWCDIWQRLVVKKGRRHPLPNLGLALLPCGMSKDCHVSVKCGLFVYGVCARRPMETAKPKPGPAPHNSPNLQILVGKVVEVRHFPFHETLAQICSMSTLFVTLCI